MAKKKETKYDKLHPVSLLLRGDQVDYLNNLQRETTGARRELGKHPDKEKITKNTYIRCLIEILKTKASRLDITNVINEDDLLKRLKKIF